MWPAAKGDFFGECPSLFCAPVGWVWRRMLRAKIDPLLSCVEMLHCCHD